MTNHSEVIEVADGHLRHLLASENHLDMTGAQLQSGPKGSSSNQPDQAQHRSADGNPWIIRRYLCAEL